MLRSGFSNAVDNSCFINSHSGQRVNVGLSRVSATAFELEQQVCQELSLFYSLINVNNVLLLQICNSNTSFHFRNVCMCLICDKEKVM